MIVISPAKRLANNKCEISLEPTCPVFMQEANELAKILGQMSSEELGDMMHVSGNIAELNADRYKNWNKVDQIENRAIFQFEGDVFKHLNAKSMNSDEVNYMNSNLRILSGIYGILKPSDEMNPYRLEMGTQHAFGDAKNLYEFWGDKVASALNKELGDSCLFNLASDEYFSVIKNHVNEQKVVNFKFLSLSGGKERVVGVIAKRARGEMARHLIENQITNPNDVTSFNKMDFVFREKINNTFVFSNS